MKFLVTTGSIAMAFCVMALLPAGCSGQEEREDVQLRVDSTPIDRQETTVVSSYAGVLNQVRPAVVSVFSSRMIDEPLLSENAPALERFFGSRRHREMPDLIQSGLGSGVIVSSQGYVLTNNHVIDGADEVAVALEDGREVTAEVVGADPRTDIAVLKIAAEDLPSAVLADSDVVAVGDVVFALGNALGIGHAVTTGIISARGRTSMGILGEGGYEDFLQTDASMNVGNSGGPLVDSRGRVIGINTAIASPGGGNVGIGFAIPINLARNVMENLIRHGEVVRGFLGVTLQDMTSDLAEEFGVDKGGVLVVNVLEKSPAAGAGIERGDVVVSLNGDPVESAGLLRLRVGQMPPDEEVRVSVLRNGNRLEVPVVLGRLEEPKVEEEPEAELEGDELLRGIGVEVLTPQLRDQLEIAEGVDGLVVVEVDRRSPHADVFPVGALVVQVNREPATDVETARKLIRDGRNLFLLLVDGSFQYVTVRVEGS